MVERGGEVGGRRRWWNVEVRWEAAVRGDGGIVELGGGQAAVRGDGGSVCSVENGDGGSVEISRERNVRANCLGILHFYHLLAFSNARGINGNLAFVLLHRIMEKEKMERNSVGER